MNIKTEVKSFPASLSSFCGTVQKPAVLVVVDWNIAVRIFSGTDISEKEAFHSETRKKTKPNERRIALDRTASLL